MDLREKVLELCSYSNEQEWFEFKENWFQADTLGEYNRILQVYPPWYFIIL